MGSVGYAVHNKEATVNRLTKEIIVEAENEKRKQKETTCHIRIEKDETSGKEKKYTRVNRI